MPGQPLNVMNGNDPKLVDMITLQRRTFDNAKRRQIVYDIQRYLAENAYFLSNASVKVVSAWEPHIKNYMPNNGFDYGGRGMGGRGEKKKRRPPPPPPPGGAAGGGSARTAPPRRP